jgi:urease accessory protein
MTDAAAIYRLLAWLSPGYPIGAYTYSHGLEQAVETGLVDSAETTGAWIGDVIAYGAGYADTVFLSEAYRAIKADDTFRLAGAAELAAAFNTTRELALETHAQGQAFLEITGSAWHTETLDALRTAWDGPYAFPVALGCAAAGHDLGLTETSLGYLQAFASNLVSAAVRLVPLGQTDGQRISAAFEPIVATTVERGLAADIDDVATASLMTDVCSMKHETQHTRLFRS